MANSGVNILYVDDEKGNCDYFKSAFRREHIIHTAYSGLEALEILQKSENISLILTDQRMPEMSGVEFLERSLKKTRSVYLGRKEPNIVPGHDRKGGSAHAPYASITWVRFKGSHRRAKALSASQPPQRGSPAMTHDWTENRARSSPA